MTTPDMIGWGASAILIATLARQGWHQWKDPDPRGVSHWLFLGQMSASVGFGLLASRSATAMIMPLWQ